MQIKAVADKPLKRLKDKNVSGFLDKNLKLSHAAGRTPRGVKTRILDLTAFMWLLIL